MCMHHAICWELHGWNVNGTDGFLPLNTEEGAVAVEYDQFQKELMIQHIIAIPDNTYPHNFKTTGVGKERENIEFDTVHRSIEDGPEYFLL